MDVDEIIELFNPLDKWEVGSFRGEIFATIMKYMAVSVTQGYSRCEDAHNCMGEIQDILARAVKDEHI